VFRSEKLFPTIHHIHQLIFFMFSFTLASWNNENQTTIFVNKTANFAKERKGGPKYAFSGRSWQFVLAGFCNERTDGLLGFSIFCRIHLDFSDAVG
jgi:hypothetical protein